MDALALVSEDKPYLSCTCIVDNIVPIAFIALCLFAEGLACP